MKKTVIVSLAVSALMLASTATAFAAAPNKSPQSTQTVTAVKTAPAASSISGTVTAVTDGTITVKTPSGESWIVPTFQFKDVAGFSSLGLEVGTAVTVKRATSTAGLTVSSAQPISLSGSSSSAKIVNIGSIDPSKIKIITTGLTPAGGIFPASSITANGVTVSLPD